MCLASLFRQQQHCKVVNEWNDDDDEQRQMFHEDITKYSGLVHCNYENKCVENKPDTYMIHYEGGIGIISR